MLEPKLNETAAERIAIHATRLEGLTDADFLAVLGNAEPMPELELLDSAWDDPAMWDRLGLMLACAEEIGRRGLVEGIPTLYGLAPLDDPWELTQSIRHGPELAAKYHPGVLETIMRNLIGHPRSGTRLWAARELGILRDEASLHALRRVAEADEEPLVREEAIFSLEMLAIANAKLKSGLTTVIHSLATKDPDQGVRRAAVSALGKLNEQLAAPLRPRPAEPYMDPDWIGQVSGPDGFQATRRIVRALMTGDIRDDRLDHALTRHGLTLAMTPGTGVYPPREPTSAGGSAPEWHAKVALFGVRAAGATREPLRLWAIIELRRATPDEVRARLISIDAD